MCVHVDNKQSCDVVIARLRSSIHSLLHQHRDLHQSTYLYLSEDRELTSHHLEQLGLANSTLPSSVSIETCGNQRCLGQPIAIQ
jgi:hypothetical protein